MAAPQKVKLPPRKRRKQQGFNWGSWAGGIVVGIVVTLSFQHIDYQSLFDDDKPAPTDNKNVAADKPDLLDSLPIEFYKLLPNREEQIPDHLISRQIREDSPQKPMDKPGRYRLQAGSFQKIKDADRRRASILFLGLETHIQTVSHGGTKWHRVMLGPFESLKHLEVARHRLSKNNIKTIVLKLKIQG